MGSLVQEEGWLWLIRARLPVRKEATVARNPEKAGQGLGMVLAVCLKGEVSMRPLVLCLMAPLGSAKVDVRLPTPAPD